MGTDGTAIITSERLSFMRNLELFIRRHIWLKHVFKLPLTHLFTVFGMKTSSPRLFDRPIVKMLTSNVSDWPVVKFYQIPTAYFPILPKEVKMTLVQTK